MDSLKFRRPTLRGIFVASVILIFLIFSPIGRRALVPKPSRSELALERTLDDIRFEGTSLKDALQSIGSRAGIEIRVDWPQLDKEISRLGPVSLRLRKVTTRRAIEAALARSASNPQWIAIEPAGDVIQVGITGNMPACETMRLYDIHELIDDQVSSIQRWTRGWRPADPLEGQHDGSCCLSAAPEEVSTDDIAEDIAHLATTLTDEPGMHQNGDLNGFCGHIVMRGCPSEQKRVGDLLKRLKSAVRAPTQSNARNPDVLRQGQAELGRRIAHLDLKNVTVSEAIRRLEQQVRVRRQRSR